MSACSSGFRKEDAVKLLDWIILIAVIAAVACAAYFAFRRGRKGGCSCGCGSCPGRDGCGNKKE